MPTQRLDLWKGQKYEELTMLCKSNQMQMVCRSKVDILLHRPNGPNWAIREDIRHNLRKYWANWRVVNFSALLLGFQPDLSFGNLWDLFKRIFTLWKGINVCQENEYKIWRKIIGINIGGLKMGENAIQILVSSIGSRVVMIGCETRCD